MAAPCYELVPTDREDGVFRVERPGRIEYGPKGCRGWALAGTMLREPAPRAAEEDAPEATDGRVDAEISESMAQNIIYERIPQNRDVSAAHR
jgi:hypothetical protein